MSPPSAPGELAFLLDGGGARAAYQAGYLRGLGRLLPDLEVPILVGVSAGAINAVWLASRPGNFRQRTESLAEVWGALTSSDVVDVRGPRLAARAIRWAARLGGGGRGRDPRGLLDNAPLRATLRRVLECPDGGLPGVAERLADGRLRALAVTATAYATGRSITFVQGRQLTHWERPTRRSREGEVRLEHVLASAALPFLFPAVELDDGWYGDGGIRMTTPLSPAVHLGAGRILAISTRHVRGAGEAEEATPDDYPPAAQVAGVLLDAIFLDALDGDARRLERINHLVAQLDHDSLRSIGLWVARPTRDLGRLATAHEALLPAALRFLARGTGTKETESNDMLSMILFERLYLRELLEAGEADALADGESLAAFCRG